MRCLDTECLPCGQHYPELHAQGGEACVQVNRCCCWLCRKVSCRNLARRVHSMQLIFQLSGCSQHNRLMRFVKAKKDWLPEGHKCANVCIPCGHTGYPACPLEPACSRRRSLQDMKQFIDGPTGEKVRSCNPPKPAGQHVHYLVVSWVLHLQHVLTHPAAGCK